MNMLRKVTLPMRVVQTRFIGTANNGPDSATAGKRLIIEPLSGRELIRVQGDEVVPFLQGLMTNDLDNLQPSTASAAPASMYSMFLNKAGRVLYDSIIYRTQEPSTYLVECDTRVADELRRHLRLYRVRRKIQIDAVADVYQPWVVFKPDATNNAQIDISGVTDDIFATPDPRLRDLGLRVITGKDKSWQDLARVFTKSDHHIPEQSNNECNYRLHRYRYGVGEGMDELPPGKSFPLEANGDYLQGVSFQKGCYIGQELTARVYHTGVIRKRLMPLQLSAPVTTNAAAVLLLSGANVGIIRGSIAHNALGLMRVEKVINEAKLMVDDSPCYAVKPNWWPSTEQASTASKREAF